MHAFDENRNLTLVNRSTYIKEIFDYGGITSGNYSLTSLLSAVTIGDHFKDEYSIELAHTALSLSTKLYEDFPYTTLDAADDTSNHIVYKFEWQIYQRLDYRLPPAPIIKFIEPCSYTPKILAPIFEFIIRDICEDPDMLKISPAAIILGIVILYKHRRLRAIRAYHNYLFSSIIRRIHLEYGIPINEVIHHYKIFLESSNSTDVS